MGETPPRKNRQATEERLTACWMAMVENENDRPTVTEFARRVGIAPVTLYHRYPEWAEKVRLRRDHDRDQPRRVSPASIKRQATKDAEQEELVGKLRRTLAATKAELADVRRDRDRWQNIAKELEEHRAVNERLRAVIQRFGEAVKMHLDASKAQAILTEVSEFQERHLRVIKPEQR